MPSPPPCPDRIFEVFCQNGSIIELSSVTGLHVLIWTGPVFTKSCLPQMNVKLLIWGKEYVCDVASCSKAELKENFAVQKMSDKKSNHSKPY